MKFVITKTLMDDALNKVSKGISVKTPMPVLTGIKIVLRNNKLTFISTNREISVKVEYLQKEGLQLLEEGEIVAPGKLLIDIVKKVDNNDLIDITTLESHDRAKIIKITTNNLDVSLTPLDGENFPIVNFELKVNSFRVSSKELKQLIRQTSFACANNESRAIALTAENFVVRDGNAVVTCTDSFRLARKIMPLSDNGLNVQMNIPAKSLEEFSKIISDDVAIDVYPTNNVVLFKAENLSFITRLIEGTYHDTSALFSIPEVLKIKFIRSELMSAVDKASLFANAGTSTLNFVKIELNSAKQEVKVASNSSAQGQVTVKLIPVEISEKRDFNVAFSANNLMDALKAFDDIEISIAFTGEIKPARITSEKDENLTQILIPVRTF